MMNGSAGSPVTTFGTYVLKKPAAIVAAVTIAMRLKKR
jgi:hypothetical protein